MKLEAIRLNSKCDDDNGSDNNDDDDDDDHNNHDSVDDDDTRVRVELSCNSLAGFTREELRRQHLNMIGNILVIILMSVGSLQMFFDSKCYQEKLLRVSAVDERKSHWRSCTIPFLIVPNPTPISLCLL